MMQLIENYTYYGYLTAAISYLLLLLFILPELKKNSAAVSCLLAVVFSLWWSSYIAFILYNKTLFIADSLPLETVRNAAWFFFLITLLSQQQFNNNYSLFIRSRPIHILILFFVVIFSVELFPELRGQLKNIIGQRVQIRLLAHLIFSIIGLILVEQLYRNSESRETVKFLCLALAALFIVDFIIYSKSLLFVQIDSVMWNSRGVLNALVVPLLAVAMRRLQTNESKMTLSRHMVFHSTVLLGTSLYLLVMSLTGFYIRDYGGVWGQNAQVVFIFFALLMLLVLFASGRVRAWLKVYFNKHFFHYRYDYRNEWLKLSKILAQLHELNELSGFIIRTMMDLADSYGGGLWLKNEQGDFYFAEENNLGFEPPPLIHAHHSLIQFLLKKHWVIDFFEFAHSPEMYDGADLSQWYADDKKVYLIIPLFLQNDLEAFVVLTQAKIPRTLNWEDHDVLKTVGMQLANALALSHASDALSRSRQFEAYNQISAYLVHDLKNLVAQLALIVKNAEKHKHNPDFIDDSIETLKNVVHKIEHILGQLKKGKVRAQNSHLVNLLDVIDDVAKQQASNKPTLQLLANQEDIEVLAERSKLVAILGHLVQNAQEATDDTGFVRLELSQDAQFAIIQISDNGTGMDNKFIAERLFKPFDTTKGNAGMGIGVYEARDYILKHAGQITVNSQLGIGTTFIIRLPLANPLSL